VKRHRLRFVDDPSNDDPRFARNRLRAQVWPALVGAFERAEASLADAARRVARADALLDEIAEADLADLADDAASLDVTHWRRLSDARRGNALLAWLRLSGIATAALADRLADELPAARNGARWPAAPGCELRLHRGRLRLEADSVHRLPGSTDAVVSITGPGRYRIAGWKGELVVERVDRDGAAASALTLLRARPRTGGETFQSAPRSTPRSLKKQFQSSGIPAWQRDGPMLFAGERLLFVPGLGIDARMRARAGEPQFSLRWDRGRDH
jgi:tRNA(Ile)-lysidine synthase